MSALSFVGGLAKTGLSAASGFLGGFQAKTLITAGLVVAVLCALFWVYHKGSVHGADKVTAKVEKAHAVAVQDAHTDERAMQASSDKIGRTTATATAAEIDVVSQTIRELHDAYDARDAAAAAAAPAFDLAGVSAPINRVVDRARGAADTADAARGTGNAGAP